MAYNPTHALQLLRLGTQNPVAVFHAGQEAAIQHVVEGRGRLLVVQRTGWGIAPSKPEMWTGFFGFRAMCHMVPSYWWMTW